jgi:hypothetical protein
MLVPDQVRTYNTVIQHPQQTLVPLNWSYIVMIPKKKDAIESKD